MATLIKGLRNNRQVLFDTGKFDEWCVYIVESDGTKKAPFDVTYFTDLHNISHHYPDGKVYQDFVAIYNLTSRTVNPQILTLIDKIVFTYNIEHQVIAEQWFAVIYAAMIAEENKAKAVLKKRVKRLGMHQVLILGMPANEAAIFSYGKKWRDLDTIMRSYGF